MSRLRAGDWVEVRSKQDVLRTLDKSGRLEGLPFMPEMFEYCGQRVRVSSSAHKTCGPINGQYVALQTSNLVHLGKRCDGSAHDGCQNRCLLFWHTAWLRPADAPTIDGHNHGDGVVTTTRQADSALAAKGCGECTYRDVVAATRLTDLDGAKRYSCQATALQSYARPLKWWDARAYWKSLRTRNHTLRELINGISFMIFCKIAGSHAERFGACRLYDAFQAWRGGIPFPRRFGLVPPGKQTPVIARGLKAGDYVRIKSHREILETLTHDGRNRGMYFDAELVPFCGRIFRVSAMVERFIDEEVGVMRHMKTPAAILENVYCLSLYAGKRIFCTRGYCSWWREAWLERVTEHEAACDGSKRALAKLDVAGLKSLLPPGCATRPNYSPPEARQ